MLCWNCRKQDALPNQRLCQDCQSSQKKRWADNKRQAVLAQRQERIALNLCSSCGKRPAAPGFKQCLECKAKHTTDVALRRRAWRSAGICSRCGKHPATIGTMCKQCRDGRNETHRLGARRRKKARIKLGLCIQCKLLNDTPQFSTCSTCRAERRDKAAKNRLTSLQYSILERDGFACQLCSIDKYLHVHHIDGNGTGSPNPNDDPDNLITLCRRCHNAITILRACGNPKRTTYLILA